MIDRLDSDYFAILGFKRREQAKNILPTYHWFLPKAIRFHASYLDGMPDDLRELVRTTAKKIFVSSEPPIGQGPTRRCRNSSIWAASFMRFRPWDARSGRRRPKGP